MTEYNFLLNDRIQKIKSINEKYNLEDNAYLSFSGGKDSVVLTKLLDLAIPNNKIPRVYCNTGIEYREMVNFIKELQKKDDRIIIIKPKQNIKEMLEKVGYPFKSKEHSHKLNLWQKGNRTKSLLKYFETEDKNRNGFSCPKKLLYQTSKDFNLKISDNCCKVLKKDVLNEWSKQNNKSISLLGLRNNEGGQRRNKTNCITLKGSVLKSFSPLLVLDDVFINEFIEKENIELCTLYKPPFNFKRTGCKGCPFAIDLQRELDLLSKNFPEEEKQCEIIFGKVYDEYRRVGYRLRKQMNNDDLLTW